MPTRISTYAYMVAAFSLATAVIVSADWPAMLRFFGWIAGGAG